MVKIPRVLTANQRFDNVDMYMYKRPEVVPQLPGVIRSRTETGPVLGFRPREAPENSLEPRRGRMFIVQVARLPNPVGVE